MRILGLHATGHDSGAALLAGDELVAIGEERLSRVKNDGAFPARAIAHVLGGAPLASVDLVVCDVSDGETARARTALAAAGYAGEVLLVEHHLAHAASAHFVAPDDGAAILVVDAGGTRVAEWPADRPRPASFPGGAADQELQSFYLARGRRLERLHGTWSRPGLRLGIGWLYALVTLHLGFGPLDAGKTMGLAAHAPSGPADDVWPWLTPGGDLLFRSDVDVARPATAARWLAELTGVPARLGGEPLDERHAAVAAKLQRTTEAFMLALARQLHAATNAETLCLAGGVALNVLANRRLADESPFRRVAVQPAATDTGIALGCALAGAVARGVPIPPCPEVSCLARPPSAAAHDAAAARAEAEGFLVERPADLLGQVVARLAAGQIVGWVEGASELGPRALGHRSLLADARDPAAKERVNARVKHREAFRPFAPVVLEERAGELFDLALPSANMLFAARVHEAARARVPAVTHADGTARVQTVSRTFPGRLRTLLERFAAETGVPALLNTSLNGPGEPIAETPDDALALFVGSQMDALVLGDWLVARQPRPSRPAAP